MSSTKCMFTYVQDVPGDFRCVEHDHDCCEIVYCVGCDGVLIQDGKQFRYQDDSVFVYQPGGRHFVVNNTPGRHICVGVTGQAVIGIQAGAWNQCASIKWIFDRVAAASATASPNKAERLDYLSALAALEVRELSATSQSDLAPALRAKAIIDESFHEEIDIASLARQVYLSPDYFRYVFKTQIGQPVIAYVIAKRIDHAKKLLTESTAPIHVVAEQCGFSSPYYFSRAFKRMTGQSPQDYRREWRNRKTL